MDNFVTLIGTEQVQAAASTIRSAADQIYNASGFMQQTLERHEQFMDDWLTRFEAVLVKIQEVKSDGIE